MQVSAGTLRHGRHRCAWSWSYKYLLATQDEGMLGLNSDPLLKAVHALNCWTISEVFLSHLYKNKTKTWIWGLNSSCQADTQALYSRGPPCWPSVSNEYTLLYTFQVTSCSIYPFMPSRLELVYAAGWKVLRKYLHYLCWSYNCVQKGAATT